MSDTTDTRATLPTSTENYTVLSDFDMLAIHNKTQIYYRFVFFTEVMFSF